MVPGPATAEEEEPPPRDPDPRQRQVEKQPVPGGARQPFRRRRAPHAVSRLLQAYAGDELEAQLEHALVRAVLEHDVVRRRLHLQELQPAALADDLADVHPAN